MQITRDSFSPETNPNMSETPKDTNVPASAAKPADVEPPKKKAPRKKAKKSKDMPKRPLSAYNLFFQIERKKLMEAKEKGETPDDFDVASVSSDSDGDAQDKRKRASLFQAIAQCIANRWKSLPSDERVKFEEMAKEEMKKYRKKKDEYQQRMVRETLDLSNRSAAGAVGGLGGLSGLGIGATGLYAPGLLGGHLVPGAAQAPAVGILGAQQSLGIQELLQRQALLGQDPRLSSLQLAGTANPTLERLLLLRALQNEQAAGLRHGGLVSGAGVGYLGGLPGSVDLRLAGGPPPAAAAAPGAVADLPPEELIRYLNARRGAQPPPGV